MIKTYFADSQAICEEEVQAEIEEKSQLQPKNQNNLINLEEFDTNGKANLKGLSVILKGFLT